MPRTTKLLNRVTRMANKALIRRASRVIPTANKLRTYKALKAKVPAINSLLYLKAMDHLYYKAIHTRLKATYYKEVMHHKERISIYLTDQLSKWFTDRINKAIICQINNISRVGKANLEAHVHKEAPAARELQT